jgi:hypothetical protein
MQPRRHRPGLEADISERHHTSTPSHTTTTCDQAAALIPLQVEAQNLHLNIQELGHARQRDLFVKDREEPRKFFFSTVRVQGDGVDELAQGLAWHWAQVTRLPLSTSTLGAAAVTTACVVIARRRDRLRRGEQKLPKRKRQTGRPVHRVIDALVADTVALDNLAVATGVLVGAAVVVAGGAAVAVLRRAT